MVNNYAFPEADCRWMPAPPPSNNPPQQLHYAINYLDSPVIFFCVPSYFGTRPQVRVIDFGWGDEFIGNEIDLRWDERALMRGKETWPEFERRQPSENWCILPLRWEAHSPNDCMVKTNLKDCWTAVIACVILWTPVLFFESSEQSIETMRNANPWF